MNTQLLGPGLHLCAALHRSDWWEKARIHLSPVLWWFQHCHCLGTSVGVLFLDSGICTRGHGAGNWFLHLLSSKRAKVFRTAGAKQALKHEL